jgi:gliding motility-associated-like protein
MKKALHFSVSRKILVTLCIALSFFSKSWAQQPVGLPTCTGYSSTLLYYISGNQIYNYDPCLPFSNTNPQANTISGAAGGDGLALGANIYAAAPAVTFYVSGTAGNNYYWYNGTTWVNSGFNPSNTAAVNPTQSGSYLYNLVGFTGEVYQNASTGNGTLLTTVTGFNGNGPFDLQGDGLGNWYILDNVAQYMREYNSTGTLVNTWNLVGNPTGSTAGGGFGIIGNTVYFHVNTSPGFWKGTMSGTNINCTSISAGLNPGPEDFATCQLGSIGPTGSSTKDTAFYCGVGPAIPLISSGNGPYTWQIVSGNVQLVGSGDTVMATATSTSVVQVVAASASSCVSNVDTFLIVVPQITGNAHAGLPDTIFGCGTYIDTLKGSFTDNANWLKYHVKWTPAGSVLAGDTTLTAVINPTQNTLFYLTINSDSTQGNCSWEDSVQVTLINKNVIANFSDSIMWSCIVDSVAFTNLNTSLVDSFRWSFGDNTYSTDSFPANHPYPVQGIYNVKLVVKNNKCADSLTLSINTLHPLKAAFTTDKDLICQNSVMNFTNTSTTTTINNIAPSFTWYYGDGGTSQQFAAPYTYGFADTGDYTIMLVAQDFVPCFDTTYKTISVLSLPKQYQGDTSFCNPNTDIPIGFQVHNADKYLWSNGAQTPFFIPDTAGTYTLTASNYCGSDQSTYFVKLWDCDHCLFVPNAFTPNNDNLNDEFRVRLICPMRTFDIKVVNRYGQVVYSSNSFHAGWDGKFGGVDQEVGTYMWEIRYTPDLANAHELSMKGDVTLIR